MSIIPVVLITQTLADAFRFSEEIKNSIEPRPGVHNDEALHAYMRLAKKINAAGIVPVVCLWHFNKPKIK